MRHKQPVTCKCKHSHDIYHLRIMIAWPAGKLQCIKKRSEKGLWPKQGRTWSAIMFEDFQSAQWSTTVSASQVWCEPRKHFPHHYPTSSLDFWQQEIWNCLCNLCQFLTPSSVCCYRSLVCQFRQHLFSLLSGFTLSSLTDRTGGPI